MRLLFSILLSLTVLIQSISGSILVFKFQAQKKYIAAKLCENRNNPSKGCAGKCYLKKLLKQNEEAEKALPGSIKEKLEVAYIIQPPFVFTGDSPVINVSCTYNYFFFVPVSPVFSQIQPPRA